MSSKVKLPKEVAEAIEKVWSSYGSGYTKHMVLTNWSMLKEEHAEEYNEISSYAYSYPIKYMSALVDGYEIEESPQEKVVRLYNTPNVAMYNPSSYKAGVMDALNALGMVIEGVNA